MRCTWISRTSSPAFSRSAVMLAAVSALVLPAAACADQSAPVGTSPGSASNEQKPLELPQSPVGEQARWFIAAAETPPITAEDYAQRFSEAFQTQLTVDGLNSAIAQVGAFTPREIVNATTNSLTILVEAGGEELHLLMAVDSEGRIDTLLFTPAVEMPAPPTDWASVDARVGQLAPSTAYLAAKVVDGRCEPVHSVASNEPQPLASMFKLYVLDAVVRQVQAGLLGWDDRMPITDEIKSWPSGELQDRSSGSEVTVREAARLMISISDNTATDMLIREVGREAVEESIRRLSASPELTIPLLTTKEMFKLKTVDYPARADEYAALDPAAQRAYLEGPLAAVPLPPVAEAASWTTPRHIESIEWFGSAEDMCNAYASLADSGDRAVGQALSANDGGLGLDPAEWSNVWFKGGSEPGVLTLGYYAQAPSGDGYAVIVLTANPDAMENPATAMTLTNEMLSLVKGGFELAAP